MGEEEVLRFKTAEKVNLEFGWRYAGKKDSGTQPHIRIRMDSPDGQFDEKLKIWDDLLSSFKPVAQ